MKACLVSVLIIPVTIKPGNDWHITLHDMKLKKRKKVKKYCATYHYWASRRELGVLIIRETASNSEKGTRHSRTYICVLTLFNWKNKDNIHPISNIIKWDQKWNLGQWDSSVYRSTCHQTWSPEFNRWEVENWLLQFVLWPPHQHHGVYVHRPNSHT